ncbi:DNA topology modulation protein FlaR [Virgibacillus indicus]|uniref:DNA topology modulation protein FlaR n=1 Tax=Virgibacillus indicus TaxID=2024554 RepID=A0A265NDV9_9BACI|nr:AAA family ATPase [Virgibacillus indicus]OZU89644.1 DNA topology modulation protein FlaR [Virgibacillus indicus]
MERAIPKRIHIIGSVGSGKTTLAKMLSAQLHIPCYELDNVVWERFKTGDIRRTDEKRDEYLNKIINSNNWITEGVHHKWVSPCFQNADVILFLDTRMSTRRLRIIKRFFMQKIGLEKANYKPTFKILKDLYKYNTVFEYRSKPEIFDMLNPYDSKLIVLKSNSEIINCFN